MMAHSPIGASSMDRWSKCPGSVRLSKDIESKSSVYAEEGTEAHRLAAQWLSQGVAPVFPDIDMMNAVDTYVTYVGQQQFTRSATAFFEHQFDLSDIHPGCFGTADAVIWDPKTRHLEVVDFKYGQGVFVSAMNNPQLRYYGLGALIDLKLPAKTIDLTIVQPRYESIDGPIRSEQLGSIDLLEFTADLIMYAKATENPNAPLNPGDWCRWCPAGQAFACPELNKRTKEIAKTEFSVAAGPLTPYGEEQLKKALDSREFVKAWLKTLDEFAYQVLEAGGTIPGYKLVAKRPTRKWKDEGQATIALNRYTGKVDIYEPKTLKSPAQMEKLIKDKEVLTPLIESISSGHTVVEESDKRPSVKQSAKDEFSTPSFLE
jgi:hypothetical protein